MGLGKDCFKDETYLTDVWLSSATGLTSIGEGAFSNCTGLESLYIPETVQSIGTTAFDGCDNLLLEISKGTYAHQYVHDANRRYTYLGNYNHYLDAEQTQWLIHDSFCKY